MNAPVRLRDRVAIAAELGALAAAEAVIYGRPSTQRDFALGVEHALLWAEFATPTPPSAPDAGPRDLRGRAGRAQAR